MKIYDISKELFSAPVFPGDPAPSFEKVSDMDSGAVCNLSRLALGSHNGTHMDAPRHFYREGKTVDALDLDKCVGRCKLAALEGKVTAEQINGLLEDGTQRLLLRGEIELTPEAARAMTAYGLLFLGVEGLTVGPMSGPLPVHLELLGKETVILESAALSEVPEGTYFLVSAPLKLGGLDGAPARPLLLDFDAP